MTYDDLPIIRIKPQPTDAELQAERDAKHQLAVTKWENDDDEDWPIGSVTA